MAVAASTIVLTVRLLIFTAYVLAGAAIFQVLEQKNYELELQRTADLRDNIVKKYNISRQDVKSWSRTFSSNPLVEDVSLEWNFANSIIYSIVTITTIGYGNIVPKTFGGRLFCIFYALLGIPGTCLTLKSVGDKIAETISCSMETFEKRILKRKHPKNLELKTAISSIVLTFVILPLLAGIVYLRKKHWTYFNCVYFTFTTLTTIGYGDFLPSFKHNFDFLLIILAFVGLAFVSSILCSLNTLLDTFGLSARIVKSVKRRSEESSSGDEQEEGRELIVNGKKESSNNKENKQDAIEKECNSESDTFKEESNKPLNNYDISNRGKAGKRESVSMGIMQA